MNRSSEVTIEWADGEYTFALKLAQIEELQEKCDAGIGEILTRIMKVEICNIDDEIAILPQTNISDIYHTLRLGLIGGGMPPADAMKIVDRYLLPWMHNVNAVREILLAVCYGIEDIDEDDSHLEKNQAVMEK